MKLTLLSLILLFAFSETARSGNTPLEFDGEKMYGLGSAPDDSCKNFAIKVLSNKDVLCYGDANGSVLVSSNSGASPVSYFWKIAPGNNDSSLTNAKAGLYEVLAIDKRNCRDSMFVQVSEPDMLSANIISFKDVSCSGSNDGKATVAVQGGVQPYSYSWSTSPKQTSTTAYNLTKGYYTTRVSDLNKCSTFVAVNIDEPTPIYISITNQEQVNCYGGNNGQVSVKVWGGMPKYNVVWNTTPNQFGLSLNNLKSGVYRVTVSDSVNCVVSMQIQISEPPPLTFAIDSVIQISCPGRKDASAIFRVNGGTLPYQFLWNTVPIQYTSKATGLGVGDYLATLVDAHGCKVQEWLTITEPKKMEATVVTTDITCFGMNNGVAGVAVSGGALPYNVNWNTTPAQSGYSADNLKAGLHQVTITDKNNCRIDEYYIIGQPERLDISDVFVLDASCFNRNDGNAIIHPKGGIKPYAFYWQTAPVQIVAEARDLFAGTYKAWVFDAKGCRDSLEVTVGHPAKLHAEILSKRDVTCFNFSDGNLLAKVSNGVKPIFFNWSNGSKESSINNLRAGNYLLIVSDACEDTVVLAENIKQPLPFEVPMISGPVMSAVGLSEMFNVVKNSLWVYDWRATNAGLINGRGTNEATFRFQQATEGFLNLIVTNEAGCKDTLDHQIKLFNDCFQIFPNPSKTNTTIFVPTADGERIIEVYNSRGLLIQSLIAERLNEIDLSNWPGGIYIVKIDACILKFMKETGW